MKTRISRKALQKIREFRKEYPQFTSDSKVVIAAIDHYFNKIKS